MYRKKITLTIIDILLLSKKEAYKKEYESSCSDILRTAESDAKELVKKYLESAQNHSNDIFTKYDLNNEDEKNLKIVIDLHLAYLKSLDKDSNQKIGNEKIKEISKLQKYYSTAVRNYLFPPLKFKGDRIKEFIIYLPSLILFCGFLKALIICISLDLNFTQIFTASDLLDISLDTFANRFSLYVINILMIFILNQGTSRADYKFIDSVEGDNKYRYTMLTLALAIFVGFSIIHYVQNNLYFIDSLMMVIFLIIIISLNLLNGRIINITGNQYMLIIIALLIIQSTVIDSLDIFRKDNKVSITMKDGNIINNYVYSTSQYIICKDKNMILLYPSSDLLNVKIETENPWF